ncbi:MAG: caspase family protein [Caldilineaceae bacterium]|nr:caspase family protein [Caldilineaceae bacterium]
MSKRAFLVGINEFTRADWALRGCVNDTLTMRQLLGDTFGFASDQIYVLHNQDATAQKIREGLAWLFSDYKGSGQDVRLFHFASHGTQVADTVGDEDDSLDEVIVPYDHSWTNPFKDDLLRAIFEQVPDDVRFTFIADCCHSGSINKVVYPPEVQDVRGRHVDPPKRIQKLINQAHIQRLEKEEAWLQPQLEEARGGMSFPEWLRSRETIREKLLARFRREKYKPVVINKPQTLLAACRDEETAADALIEGAHRGAFTWSLAQAIRESNGSITYGDLIKRSQFLLSNYTQNPQLDCPDDLRDRLFLSPMA